MSEVVKAIISIFWDIDKTASYNCLFNFIFGNRGGGKTYNWKKRVIKKFLRKGSQFIYLRRYKHELKKISKFFDDIIAENEFPDVKFTVKGNYFYINDKLAGMAATLSTAIIDKSVPFPLVEDIGFDEFIIDKGAYHYLPDDVLCFLNFYDTIARMKTGSEKVVVFFMANSITFINPYTLYFDLRLPYGKNFYVKPVKVYEYPDNWDDLTVEQQDALRPSLPYWWNKNLLLVELVANKNFIKAKRATEFGQLTDGTTYGDYAVNNKFLRDEETFIEKKTGKPSYSFTFKYKGTLYGVWQDYNQGKIWVSEDVDPTYYTYSMTMEDHSPNMLLIKSLNKAPTFKAFINAYKAGYVYFESMKIKNVVSEIIRLALI